MRITQVSVIWTVAITNTEVIYKFDTLVHFQNSSFLYTLYKNSTKDWNYIIVFSYPHGNYIQNNYFTKYKYYLKRCEDHYIIILRKIKNIANGDDSSTIYDT